MRLPVVSGLIYKIVGAAALVGALFFAKSCYDRSVVEKAALVASQARLAHEADSLKRALRVSDARIAHDTIVLNRAVSRYVTLRDTIVVTDTVQVKEALARCDSVAAAVGPTIASLTAGIRTRDATILNRDSTIKVLNARFPSRWTTAKHVTEGIGIGIGIGALIWAR